MKRLAAGGMADVLLARADGIAGFERHVVIKRIHAELLEEPRYVKMFLDEARLAASLHHHNIVQVNDIGEENGEYFFAMEYVHGEDVRALLAKVRERNENVPFEIAVAIIMAAASGLHHAHEKVSTTGEKLNIVHRDVAPSNILVGYDGSVKLVDFGLAKAAQRSTTTAAGTLKGKASYMSPEQCKGEAVDRRTDTFGLGIVLFELVTAQRLFKGPTEYATMAAVVDGEIPAPSRIRADVP
ncbi:MAG TPA: serine/threonine-protein kinase, partial [Kofleriaceae bacterium]